MSRFQREPPTAESYVDAEIIFLVAYLTKEKLLRKNTGCWSSPLLAQMRIRQVKDADRYLWLGHWLDEYIRRLRVAAVRDGVDTKPYTFAGRLIIRRSLFQPLDQRQRLRVKLRCEDTTLSSDTVSKSISRVFVASGADTDLRPHHLRSVFATAVFHILVQHKACVGWDLGRLQELLRHSEGPRVTLQHYVAPRLHPDVQAQARLDLLPAPSRRRMAVYRALDV